MAETIYKITLADGTELTNLTLNGNNYVSATPISADTFENNLTSVTIEGDGIAETHESMKLVHVTQMGNGTWFALRDLTETELAAIKTRSDIDYIALMCDVDL